MRILPIEVHPIWFTDDPEQVIEAGGRTCYKSESKITDDSAQEFCHKMVTKGHHAMLEHASASFRFVVDRGVSHEIVRHRIASFAQESTRYCNYSSEKFGKECTFIEPPFATSEQIKIWAEAMEAAEKAYQALLDAGASPQMARSVLPNSLKTELVMTANFREWRHFIQLRGTLAAHPQVRPVAFKVWDFLNKIAPSVFNDLDPLHC